jgi:hypothetical protein
MTSDPFKKLKITPPRRRSYCTQKSCEITALTDSCPKSGTEFVTGKKVGVMAENFQMEVCSRYNQQRGKYKLEL